VEKVNVVMNKPIKEEEDAEIIDLTVSLCPVLPSITEEPLNPVLTVNQQSSSNAIQSILDEQNLSIACRRKRRYDRINYAELLRAGFEDSNTDKKRRAVRSIPCSSNEIEETPMAIGDPVGSVN
ncbi:hypothetical protein PENTCL1PPCAC_4058, partial [Pristionchus entomophagus]